MGKKAGAKKPPQNVLIIGGAGWNNIGDDLIAQALTKWVASKGHQVSVIGGPNPFRGGGNTGLHGNFSSRVALAWRIARADHVLIGGGGLLDDREPFFYRPFTRAAMVCRATGTPYSLVGIGVGPIQRQSSKQAYSEAANGAARVYVRDAESRARLQSCGTSRKIDVIHDPVLWDIGKSPEKPARYDLAVNLRNWHSEEYLRGGHVGPIDEQVADAVAGAINARLNGSGRLALVSMSNHPGDDDATPLERLRSKLHTTDVKTYFSASPEEVEDALESSTAVLSMRLHGCLIGVRAGRQVIGLAYDPKVSQQGNALGYPAVPLDESFADTGRQQIESAFTIAPSATASFPAPPLPWE